MVTVSFPEVLGLIWELTKKTEAADLYNPGEIPLLSRLNPPLGRRVGSGTSDEYCSALFAESLTPGENNILLLVIYKSPRLPSVIFQ